MEIVAVDDVPRRDHRQVAHLAPSLVEIAASRDEWTSAVEVLDDDEQVLVLRDSDDEHVWLIDFPGGRHGTTVFTVVDRIRSPQLVRRALDALGLNETIVEWRREDLDW